MEAMPPIGETLREARMRQRIDIIEVERATKIRAKYLRALENEEFDVLPGPTFARSFLKTYADYLGLDSRLLTDEFRGRYEPPEEESQHFTPTPPRRRDPRRDRGRGPSRGLIAGLVLVALVGVLLALGLTAGDAGDPATDAGSPPTTGTQPERGARRRPRPAPTTVTLRIVPTEATYLCVDRGAGTDPLYEGTATEPRTFKGRRLRINLGRPSARLTVNGRRVPLEEGPDAVRLAFSPGARPRPLPLGEGPCV